MRFSKSTCGSVCLGVGLHRPLCHSHRHLQGDTTVQRLCVVPVPYRDSAGVTGAPRTSNHGSRQAMAIDPATAQLVTEVLFVQTGFVDDCRWITYLHSTCTRVRNDLASRPNRPHMGSLTGTEVDLVCVSRRPKPRAPWAQLKKIHYDFSIRQLKDTPKDLFGGGYSCGNARVETSRMTKVGAGSGKQSGRPNPATSSNALEAVVSSCFSCFLPGPSVPPPHTTDRTGPLSARSPISSVYSCSSPLLTGQLLAPPGLRTVPFLPAKRPSSVLFQGLANR